MASQDVIAAGGGGDDGDVCDEGGGEAGDGGDGGGWRRLDAMPGDPLLLVLGMLDYTDLLRCGMVCRRLRQLVEHDALWKAQCRRYWLVRRLPAGVASWRECFREMFRDLGRYVGCYAEIKGAWNDLEKFLGENCPALLGNVRDGILESVLDSLEAQVGIQFPNDFRCSLRIHDGEKFLGHGLMGSMKISNHHRSEHLLDVETAVMGYTTRRSLKGCLPLTFCTRTALSQYLDMSDHGGLHKNEVFYPSAVRDQTDYGVFDLFLMGSSFTDWFTSYVNNVVTGQYPILNNEIYKYTCDKDCVAHTGDITVSVVTSFLPEFSSVNPPHYFFTYRIRIEMAKDALPENACKLIRRFWIITDANGSKEEVEGPGVVGEFPTLAAGQPARVHELHHVHDELGRHGGLLHLPPARQPRGRVHRHRATLPHGVPAAAPGAGRTAEGVTVGGGGARGVDDPIADLDIIVARTPQPSSKGRGGGGADDDRAAVFCRTPMTSNARGCSSRRYLRSAPRFTVSRQPTATTGDGLAVYFREFFFLYLLFPVGAALPRLRRSLRHKARGACFGKRPFVSPAQL
ncbi:F-box only protein 3 [Lethenteron reissneri]|uniref:F-box only protein 3 n=1 Tax=Lethenteron reissneri TaxID=7753 RepID=UPI002AB76529|nr:F-box only protein 3 [Lethenteron reissneri]